jgi:DNA-binding Lrp family transcriptional regulator
VSRTVKAAILVTTAAGRVNDAYQKIRGIKGVKDTLTVTGRADIVVLVEGSDKEISAVVNQIWKVKEIETTETLLEVTG